MGRKVSTVSSHPLSWDITTFSPSLHPWKASGQTSVFAPAAMQNSAAHPMAASPLTAKLCSDMLSAGLLSKIV